MAHIKTYARLKPSKRAYQGYEICDNILKIHIPDNKDFLVIDSQQAFRCSLSYEILFAEIFRPDATQEDVFSIAAEEIILGFLNGYNGTIFTYGQTGTGKTYTVEGNTSHYHTRGLSTRALSMIYQHLENRMDGHISVYISYLEIYQEIAYDLLNPSTKASVPIIPFSKVTVFEGPQDSCILRGLSLHLAANEEIAQMFLLQGQANRKVAETPVNQRSSRSHAVFTVYLQVRKHDSKVVVNSKLHLVDLAGSERVSKTGVDGQQLTEAKSINLSLHHLETVIIALQTDNSSSCGGEDRSRGDNPPLQKHSSASVLSSQSSDSGSRPCRFVPYRNSLLTMVLKDSLDTFPNVVGALPKWILISSSSEKEDVIVDPRLLNFLTDSSGRKNEVMDDKAVIKILKQKIISLKRKMVTCRTQGRSDSPISCNKTSAVLSAKEKADCAKIMDGFLHGVITDPVRAGINNQHHFLECLYLLKQECLLAKTSQPLADKQHEQPPVSPVQSSDSTLQLQPKGLPCGQSDYAVSEVGTSVIIGLQRPIGYNFSELSMNVSDEYYSISNSKADNTINKDLTMKCPERGHNLQTYRGDDCMSYSDRAKVKDIRRLVQKLTVLRKQPHIQSQQPGHNLYLHRLQDTENSIRQRLRNLDEQIQEQCNYLLWLENNRASSEQIGKEHLVEQHLIKCRTKFEDKLNKLLEKKAKFNQSVSPDRDSSPCIRSAQPCLNQKQVQPKQDRESESAKLSLEKLSPKTKPIAFKEVATLEKCKDPKLKARICQQQVNQRLTVNKGYILSSADNMKPLIESGIQGSAYAQCMEDLEHYLAKRHSPTASGTMRSLSKEVSCSEASQSTEKQVQSIENCLIVDDIEKAG